MPVSWQMAPSESTARSMFCAMIASACPARVLSGSAARACFIAARTSGGKSVEGKKLLDRLTKGADDLKRRTDKLQNALEHEGGSSEKHAKHFRDVVRPAMETLREAGDDLELQMPHELWPLATYREMLFVK